jgi:uncharacterized membrane protein
MRTWLQSRWDDLRGTFWFVPLLMVAGAAVLSFLTLAADGAAAERGVAITLPWTFSRGPEGARSLLAAVAGSMLTIASVCFSITVLALQQASTQFGPRLLHNFMRDRGNQLVLGTLIAAFTYCLLVLRSVNGTDDDRFVPHLSVTVGLLSGLAGVGVLIYFLHHAAASLQAENVIAAVGRELDAAIDRLYPSRVGAGPAAAGDVAPPPEGGAEVTAGASDYLQAVDADTLMRQATEHDLLLTLAYRPGQFVARGSPLLRAWPGERVTDEVAAALRGAFVLGPRRTLLQDVEFAVDQLVEIALRALSPGINDPFTAVACVDRLGAALAEFAGREFPSPRRCDEHRRLRVIAPTITADGIADAAFHQIRQAARGNATVTLRLLETIAALAPRARGSAFRPALLRHAQLVHQECRGHLTAADHAAVTGRYEAVLAAFGETTAGEGDRPRLEPGGPS